MPNFKTLTIAERKTVRNFIEELRDHADTLTTLLTNQADHAAAIALVEDHTDGRYFAYGPRNGELPAIVDRIKEGRCPNCESTAEFCDCDDEGPDNPFCECEAAPAGPDHGRREEVSTNPDAAERMRLYSAGLLRTPFLPVCVPPTVEQLRAGGKKPNQAAAHGPRNPGIENEPDHYPTAAEVDAIQEQIDFLRDDRAA